MSKYIDAEKLKAKIEKRMNILDLDSPFGIGGRVELELVLDTITSLQQEQPGVDVNLREPNVDLSEEIENFCLEYDARKEAWYNMLPKDQKLIYNPTWQNFATNLAYHFYNRGYNAIKEK